MDYSLSNLPSPFGPPINWDRILHITPSQSPRPRLASSDSPYENSVGILSDLSFGEAAHLEELNQQMISLDEINKCSLPVPIDIDSLDLPADQKSIYVIETVGSSSGASSATRRSFLVSYERRPADSAVEAQRKKLYDDMNEQRLREELLALNRKLDDMEALLKASLIHNLKQMP